MHFWQLALVTGIAEFPYVHVDSSVHQFREETWRHQVDVGSSVGTNGRSYRTAKHCVHNLTVVLWV